MSITPTMLGAGLAEREREIAWEMDAPGVSRVEVRRLHARWTLPPAAREAAVKLKVKGAGVMTYCMYAADGGSLHESFDFRVIFVTNGLRRDPERGRGNAKW